MMVIFFLFLTASIFSGIISLPFSKIINRRALQIRLSPSFVTTTDYDRQPGIYVLGLDNGKYYVGKSIMNVTARVQEHFLTGGSAWTKQHHPIEQLTPIVNTSDDLESSERAETLERMWIHGIDNVRGWQYTKIKLNENNYESIFRQMCERKDLCRKCGRQNHMASSCNYRDLASWVEPGRLPNREMILQGGDTRKRKAEDRIASMVISNGDNQQKSSQQQLRGKLNYPNTAKHKPTTTAVSAKALAVAAINNIENTTVGTIAATTNEGNPRVVDNVRPNGGPKEQGLRRKDTAIINAATATTHQIRQPVSSSSSLPPQSTMMGGSISDTIGVDVTTNTSDRPPTKPATPGDITVTTVAPNSVVLAAAGFNVASTKPNSKKKRLNNDVDGNNNNRNKSAKSKKTLWTAAARSFFFNAALACLYRSSASRWVPFTLYHVLLTPMLEPQTLLYTQWLDTKIGRGRLKTSLLFLFTLFSSVFLASCWRLVASRELKAIQVGTTVHKYTPCNSFSDTTGNKDGIGQTFPNPKP